MRKIRKQNGEAGSGMVEFALVAVVFLMVLLGIIDLGRALLSYHWVSNASRLATRYAMVRGNGCDPDKMPGCINRGPGGENGAGLPEIEAYIKSNADGIDTSKLTITGGCDVGSNFLQLPPCAAGQAVWVQVNYDFSLLSPLIPLSWTMSSVSQMTVSQ